MFVAMDLKLCACLCIYDLQINFQDGCYRPIFGRVMPLERFYSFPHFSPYVLTDNYSFDIWYIALPYQDTDQV
jgi:hypothetical protein